ncbi:helix-turn-helix transcriptional regulator [Piscinibacter gummiphilus]|uniref:Helix-turn-helix transcriptional regulator n=1 Tax=Piscinibacter gummiphilus TaxID=946333 RepID=A0ABZ0CT58_9BURK|nr:helix-turn-helix transcriptional regulator [Piscinibacter gummiphilus]WOB06281.1 helix-turn-helix transcriptional regulator [Piscinibacter gummiphilus]
MRRQTPTDASRRRTSVPPVDPLRYAPTAEHPVRAKMRRLAADTHIDPHSHPWGQLAFSVTGVIRMTATQSTYIVPPSRAVWIPPHVEHMVNVVEDAEIRTLYLHQDDRHIGPEIDAGPDSPWHQCRVIEVSSLLRELVMHLGVEPGALSPGHRPEPREHHIIALVLDELRRAQQVPIGVDLPQDKRLRALCESVLDDPTRWSTLETCAAETGASARTVARLFRSELGTTFLQWRQQVLLAKALTMAARKVPMAVISAELGYASPSAFTAMVRRSVGAPPSVFFS